MRRDRSIRRFDRCSGSERIQETSPVNLGAATTPNRRLLNIEEAAEYLNASTRFVRDRRRDGRIPALKLGGLLRFDIDDLDAYVDECREDSRLVGSEVAQS